MASIAESDPTPACRLSLKKTDGACLFLQNSNGGVFLENSEMPPPFSSRGRDLPFSVIGASIFPTSVPFLHFLGNIVCKW